MVNDNPWHKSVKATQAAFSSLKVICKILFTFNERRCSEINQNSILKNNLKINELINLKGKSRDFSKMKFHL